MIKTKRLILRQWKESDLRPFAAMNADPLVREFFPSILTEDESNQGAGLYAESIEKNGFGMWAAEVSGEFIGFIGIQKVPFVAHFTPSVEIGWRLAHRFWGHGYATEGALAVLDYGFKSLHFDEIVAFTVPANIRSRKVMERIGMRHDPKDDFDHPKLAEGHPLRRHVLYRIQKGIYHVC